MRFDNKLLTIVAIALCLGGCITACMIDSEDSDAMTAIVPGAVGSPYLYTLMSDATYDSISGSPPPGLSVSDSGSGNVIISGTPTTEGDYMFTVNAIGSDTSSISDTFVITIESALFTHTLSYDANGGENAPSDQIVSDTVSSTIMNVTADEPSRSGFNFLGWSVYSDVTSAFYTSGNIISVDANTTVLLYAVWEPIVYTITFDVSGGSVSADSESVDYSDSVTLPEYTGTLEGYTFGGWSDGTTIHSAGDSVTVTTDLTFTAIWTAEVVDDGSGDSEDPTTDDSTNIEDRRLGTTSLIVILGLLTLLYVVHHMRSQRRY